ncbi:MAG: DUF1080 domain-containing protein [Verrucomicrobiota bacterium]
MTSIKSGCFGLSMLFFAFPALAEEGFIPLFDGKTLKDWSCPEMSFWRVEDGAIVAQSTPEKPCRKNQFLVWTQGDVADFHLKLDYKIEGSAKANSGIQFRSAIKEDGHAVGYQADIDRGMKWAGAIYDEHTGRRMLAARGQNTSIARDGKRTTVAIGDRGELAKKIKLDDWNRYEIIAEGESLTLKINGTIMSQVTDSQADHQDLSGKLALQIHSGPPMKIAFKNMRLKHLD